ncbi:hypothetical protein N7492_002590 [Penicillium capsulatum]|uniref:Uncharacterized protein n=1 Tax=Penicillium capsulatum TaxID=69766 RepID=A0A9W9LVU5_9EURO|nr:hypothetical protein N7492_002590 [Penicillium capsulatum]KAJ6122810.1 hypothetical protein N7512_005275 [Penicillium capsulatum]
MVDRTTNPTRIEDAFIPIGQTKSQTGQQQPYIEEKNKEASRTISSTTTALAKDIKRIRRYLEELHRHKSQYLETLPSKNVSISTTPSDKRLDRFDIRFSLGIAMDYLAIKQFYRARGEIDRVLQIADQLNNDLVLARCFYWLGRIELEQQNFTTAHAHLDAAKLCALDGESPEGLDVEFYLDASKQRMVTRNSHAECESSDQKPPAHHGPPRQSSQGASSARPRRKRKGESVTWDLPIRPSR